MAASLTALRGWLYAFVTVDPSDARSGVNAPVLAVCGERNTHVDLQHNREPLEAAIAGNGDVTIDVIDDANVGFERAETPGDAYDTLDAALHSGSLPLLTSWLRDLAR